MRKGVSPVVAIVLLIAIAVISAVAVWSWIGPLTSKPPTGATTQYSVAILSCYPATDTIDIQNSGGVKISGQAFDLINRNTGVLLNESAVSAQTLTPGETNSSVLVGHDLTAGTSYALRAQNFPDVEFTC